MNSGKSAGIPTESYLSSLKTTLQSMRTKDFERLAARLLSKLVSVPIFIAKSGYQHGGDGGTAGAGDRHLRIECKRYKDTTELRARELLGEIDQALVADEALEAWILVTTRDVEEQLARELQKHAYQKGIAILFIAWDEVTVPTLAALCATFPEELDGLVKTDARTPPEDFRAAADDRVVSLKRELEQWALGHETLRQAAIKRLDDIWRKPRESIAIFGQDVAGGDGRHFIRRTAVMDALSNWWQRAKTSLAPLVLHGGEGVGKTFNTIAWLAENSTKLPIVLTLSSGAFCSTSVSRQSGVEKVLAEHLHDITRVRNESYWLARVRRMLKRPADEGYAFVLFIDGLNQEPSVRWLSLFGQLQSEAFLTRVAVMTSVRQYSFAAELSSLRRLNPQPVQLPVDSYDLSEGGEFDQMLAKHSVDQSELSASLIDIASIPRFFNLVIDLRGRLSGVGEITLHRLLFEYGRDLRGQRDERSFSEDEWQAWLIKLAKAHQEKRSIATVDELGGLSGGYHLSAEQIAIRNSDIIDGAFAKKSSPGTVDLDKRLVSHALGLDLLEALLACSSRECVKQELDTSIDPLRGFDDEAEILSAAVCLAIEHRREDENAVLSELLYAWLNAQNASKSHKEEVLRLAPALIAPLFDVVERAFTLTNRTPFHWSTAALKAVDRTSEPYMEEVKHRVMAWHTALPLKLRMLGTDEHAEKHNRKRRARFTKRIGKSAAGPITVLGQDFNIVEDCGSRLVGIGAYLLQGCPLQDMADLFVFHSVFMAVHGYDSDHGNYSWLCWLNEHDPVETAAALRAAASRIANFKPEPGVHSELPASVASRLYWLTGVPSDDQRAQDLRPSLDKVWDYEEDYLNDPAGSFFAVERRHAHLVLQKPALQLLSRLQRTKDLVIDPTFDIPETVADEVRAIAQSLNVSGLNAGLGTSIADHQYEELTFALARVDPQALAELERRRLRDYANRSREQRYSCALAAQNGPAARVPAGTRCHKEARRPWRF